MPVCKKVENIHRFLKEILTLLDPIPDEERKTFEAPQCENKNLTSLLFQYNFQKCTERQGLMINELCNLISQDHFDDRT